MNSLLYSFNDEQLYANRKLRKYSRKSQIPIVYNSRLINIRPLQGRVLLSEYFKYDEKW